MPKPVIEGEDVADTVRQAVFLMKVAHPELDIEADIRQDPLHAQFDRRLISQAVTNIIKNATEAIEQVPPEEVGKGRIDVIAARENDDIVIDVIDNGIGLPKVARQRLLEPYVTTREKGTGLGLAIVGRVLEDHGGKIELKDAADFRPGQRGAWMRLRFSVTGRSPDKIEGGDGAAQGAVQGAIQGADPGTDQGTERPAAATAQSEGPIAETKAPDMETNRQAEATNSETKIEAATGN
jgi:two-component system nitrogen regulation sensor histidine kinase NtrY